MPRLSFLLISGLVLVGPLLPGPSLGVSDVSEITRAAIAPPPTVNSAMISEQRGRSDDRQERQQKRTRRDGDTSSGGDPRSEQSPRSDKPRQQGATPPGRVGNAREHCTGPKRMRLPESDSCTHGPDPAPPGFNMHRPVQPLSEEVSGQVMAEMATIACDGDGQSGYRVQVLYVRASNVASRYGQYLSSIRGWAGAADQVIRASAADTGGSRTTRFVHDANCQPIVPEVIVSPRGDDDFDTMISELKSQGYRDPDRIYLTFVDTTAAGICGIGTLWDDDQPDNANWNNSGPSYARVDAGCWGGYTAAHELMHNLGGVQLSAPNSSGGFHCIDEYDVMCYSDWPDYPKMQNTCHDRERNQTRFDCNYDDYFNTNPDPGSYLATHWNAADNRFLIATDGNGTGGDTPTIAGYKKSKNSTGATLTTDEDATTAWRTKTRRRPKSAWVRFDLGEVRTISEIRWQFSSLEYADQFEIQVSDDGSTWETLSTGSNAGAIGTWESPLTIDDSGRYVRFLFSNPNKDRKLGFLSEVNISSSTTGTGGSATAANDSSAREHKATRRKR